MRALVLVASLAASGATSTAGMRDGRRCPSDHAVVAVPSGIGLRVR